MRETGSGCARGDLLYSISCIIDAIKRAVENKGLCTHRLSNVCIALKHAFFLNGESPGVLVMGALVPCVYAVRQYDFLRPQILLSAVTKMPMHLVPPRAGPVVRSPDTIRTPSGRDSVFG